MDLSYIPPTISEDGVIVELSQEDIDSEVDKWKYAVIMYVIGGTPTIGAMERFIAGQGSFSVKPKVYYHNEGYFVVNFASLEERNLVMYSGPHMINNRPIVVKQWTANFDFDEEDLKTIPIWVKLPNLPLSCWSASALSKIGSGLGQPIYADACTSNIERISYARILVEVDVTKELPKSIKVKDPKGRVMVQEVWYDWKPSYRAKCMRIGHNCQQQQQNKVIPDMRTGQQQQRAPVKQKTEWKLINTGVVGGQSQNQQEGKAKVNEQEVTKWEQVMNNGNKLTASQQQKGKKHLYLNSKYRYSMALIV
ncbi:PREDICTED: uncharacterized protein LOC109215480 [Nicotiana attenuata]|uniref:uncharacterized protein LOC109215480 n=1 Tax=Nicotiana attenuata TaxID=49451 RepID=UPI000905B64F|nr:PREDICTED: uncharacterized protein LOC109215480 [Nicotiana attenuata]